MSSIAPVSLMPYEQFAVSLDNDPITVDYSVHDVTGETVPVYAHIETGGGRFALVASEDIGSKTAKLVDIDASTNNTLVEQALKPEYGLVSVGRRHPLGALALEGTLDPTQFVAQRAGRHVIIVNGRSTHETVVAGRRLEVPARHFVDTQADFSRVVERDLKDRSEFGDPTADSPHGYFRGYKILGRQSTSVRDSVLLTTRPMSEAMYVDHHSPALQEATRHFINEYLGRYYPRAVEPQTVLHELNQYTNQVMPYNLKKVSEVATAVGSYNGLVPLSRFVAEAFGVCRQHALLAAYITETMIKNNRFPDGTVRVEKNGIPGVGGHAWAVYQAASGGDEVVIDPTQQFVGTKLEALMRHRWPYRLRSSE